VYVDGVFEPVIVMYTIYMQCFKKANKLSHYFLVLLVLWVEIDSIVSCDVVFFIKLFSSRSFLQLVSTRLTVAAVRRCTSGNRVASVLIVTSILHSCAVTLFVYHGLLGRWIGYNGT
jgi:hypothetical protein